MFARSTGVRGPFGWGPGRSRPGARVRSGPAGAQRAYRRAELRVSRSPPLRTPSRSGRSGRPGEGRPIRSACTREARRWRWSAPSRCRPQHPRHLVRERRKPELAGAGPGDEDDVAPRWRPQGIAVEDGFDPAAEPVADDRAADRAADGDPDARPAPAVGDEAGE